MKNLKYSLLAKIIAYFLVVISGCVTLSTVMGIYAMGVSDFYIESPQNVKEGLFKQMLWEDYSLVGGIFAENLNDDYFEFSNRNTNENSNQDSNENNVEDFLTSYYEETNVTYEAFDINGKRLGGNYSNKDTSFIFEFEFYNPSDAIYEDSSTNSEIETATETSSSSNQPTTPETETTSAIVVEETFEKINDTIDVNNQTTTLETETTTETSSSSNLTTTPETESSFTINIGTDEVPEMDTNSATTTYPNDDPHNEEVSDISPDELKINDTTHETIYLTFYIDDEFLAKDKFSYMDTIIDFAHPLRFTIIIIGIVFLLVGISSFIFLLCSAGHKKGYETIYLNSFARTPFDLLSATFGVIAVGIFCLTIQLSYHQDYFAIVMFSILFILAILLGTTYCVNFAARTKVGQWWKNTIIFRFLYLFHYIIVSVCDGLSKLLASLPLIWKTALLVIGGSIGSFLFLVFLTVASGDLATILLLWLLERILLIAFFLYIAIVLARLQLGCKALAKGDLSYQVNTNYMFWEFKEQGDNLNAIGEGMTLAVDERMKSERFKTELITNVSHDIKTPLTSIINYIDLISKEDTDNKSIKEYTEVLIRQSSRLKKMIDDLVEASKVSTGNIDVLLEPCEIGVLLTQAIGEYQQRMATTSLTLIAKQPDFPVKIMADGRLLWRVFDNLLNNICKYSQENTRVYLDLEIKNDSIFISFKNISKEQLNISSDELLERFVRGDSSRNTEGSGLGLSISKSLTELQNGEMQLLVDGDFFKVVLIFKALS